MIDKQKRLLLIDLCARLPYGVKVQCYRYPFPVTVLYADNINGVKFAETGGIEHIDSIKPYLRPMSSMTEEEKKEWYKVIVKSQDCSYANNESATTMVNDWYLSKGFDVRGLIPKGLAFEAPENMYKTE